jgi:Raf kinase inhibitor-like YbhB/YbcL family protein
MSSDSSRTFKLSSPDMQSGGTMPLRHVFNDWGAQGENKSPSLEWSGLPDGTKSLALTVYDPDAPTGSGFWHWVVFNISPKVNGLPQDVASHGGVPAPAIEGRTDWGKPGYGGACPPPGAPAHRYIFTLYALGVEALPLDNQASAAMVGFMITMNKIGETSFIVHYGR